MKQLIKIFLTCSFFVFFNNFSDVYASSESKVQETTSYSDWSKCMRNKKAFSDTALEMGLISMGMLISTVGSIEVKLTNPYIIGWGLVSVALTSYGEHKISRNQRVCFESENNQNEH